MIRSIVGSRAEQANEKSFVQPESFMKDDAKGICD
jgi:hypothetical protein